MGSGGAVSQLGWVPVLPVRPVRSKETEYLITQSQLRLQGPTRSCQKLRPRRLNVLVVVLSMEFHVGDASGITLPEDSLTVAPICRMMEDVARTLQLLPEQTSEAKAVMVTIAGALPLRPMKTHSVQ